MFERARATFKLKPSQRCQGEEFCTEDPRGYIARDEGATLETHCNNTCELFFTNSKSTPPELAGYFEAACRLRGKNSRGLNKYEKDLPFWAIWAYEIAENVYDQVQAEIQEESQTDGGDGTGTATSGGNSKALDITRGGDSNAFDLIEQFMQRRQRTENR